MPTLAFRYTPGALGDFSSLDNGATMSVEFKTKAQRDKHLAKLKVDPRIQWAKPSGDTTSSTSSYGR